MFIFALALASFVVVELNDNNNAFDADARATSLSLMKPTPEWITLIVILSLFIFSNWWIIASDEPRVSALITTSSISLLFSNEPKAKSLSIFLIFFGKTLFFLIWLLISHNSLAFSSLSTVTKLSPASGGSLRPNTCTGIDETASVRFCPLSFSIALTFPYSLPATAISPTFNFPFVTIILQRGPLPLSTFASITVASAKVSLFVFNSESSACKTIASSNLSILLPVSADTSTDWISPDKSSTIKSSDRSSSFIFFGFDSGLSHLLIATIIGTLADFACEMASLVCGITPSSAATIKTTISVTLAPLARISVKAACPGVSIKVIFLLLCITSYAPICWVMPPLSPETTLEFLILSNKEVFPWSTWPIIVTIGDLMSFFSAFISFDIRSFSRSSIFSLLKLWPNSVTKISAVSASIDSFIVAIIPIFINDFIKSPDFSVILFANSFTVMNSGM